MNHSKVKKLILTCLMLLVSTFSTPLLAAPLPFPAAFDMARIYSPAVLSPDGARFAVEIVRTPPDFDMARASNKSPAYLPSGKSKAATGASLHVGSMSGGNVIPVLKDADSWRPSWSPDGSLLAFYSDKEGVVNLWVFDVAAGESRIVSDAVVKARPFSWRGPHARWSPDGKKLYVPLKPDGQQPPKVADAASQAAAYGAEGAKAYVFKSKGGVSGDRQDGGVTSLDSHFRWMNNADLAEINLETGAARVVVSAGADPLPSVLRLSASGRWLCYLSVFYMDESVKGYGAQFDLATIRTEQADVKNTSVISKGLPVFTPYYTNSYRWHPSEDRIVYFRDGALWTRDFRRRGSGSEKRLARNVKGFAPKVILLTKNGDAALVAELDQDAPANSLDENRYAPVSSFLLAPLNGGAAKPVKLDLDRWELVEFIAVDDAILWQPDENALTAHVRDRATGQSVILRIGLKDGSQREMFRWAGDISHLNGDPGHRHVAALLEDLETPPDLYRFDASFSEKTRLTEINPQFSKTELGQSYIVPVSTPRFNGKFETVNVGVLMPPGAKKGDKVPAIVVAYPDFDLPASELKKFMGGDLPVPWGLFTSRGYGVVFANVLSGPGGEKGDVLKDITDSLLPQVYALANAGFVDVERLALTGNSFGGYSTAGVAARTNLFRAVIPQNGPFDISGANYGAFRDLSSSATYWQNWLERSQPRIAAHPWADLRRVIDNSPYYQADKIRSPMLILVGGDDYFVQDAQLMYTALKRLGGDVELAIYEGSGHVLSAWPDPNAIDGARRMVRFLNKHLGPGWRDEGQHPE